MSDQQSRALVLGCTGVAGSALVSRLIEDSEKSSTWSEIVGLSRDGSKIPLEVKKRSKKSTFIVRFIYADLTVDDPQRLAEQIGVEILGRITHAFFCVWIPSPLAVDEEFKINTKALDNFLNALVFSRRKLATNGADVQFPRLILLEGTKSYGIHLGPGKFSDYRVPYDEDAYTRHLTPPNFYFGWEDSLKKRQWPEWVALRPGPIIGVSVQRSSFFNFGTGFAVMCALLKSLGRTMIFPNPSDGTEKEKPLNALHDYVDSRIVAHELAWLAKLPSSTIKGKELVDACGVPAVNCSNGGTFKWLDLWPKLAQRFGMKYSLEDYFDLLKFINDPDVCAHWARLVEQHNLVSPRNLSDVVAWAGFTSSLTRSFDCHASMAKAKRLGFTKTANILDTFVSTIAELQVNNVIPPILLS